MANCSDITSSLALSSSTDAIDSVRGFWAYGYTTDPAFHPDTLPLLLYYPSIFPGLNAVASWRWRTFEAAENTASARPPTETWPGCWPCQIVSRYRHACPTE
jgi:hypothetical protein